MLHAVIRTGQDAFHFFGEVNGYNLQTLRQHVRHGAREGGPLHLRFEIEPADEVSFARHGKRWLEALAKRGTVIEVVARRGMLGAPMPIRVPAAAA